MYIPKDSVNLKDLKILKTRTGIQGPPGSGKTTSALTFPNPVVYNFDDGLSGHFGKNVIEIPAWSAEWTTARGFVPSKPGKSKHPNRKDCFVDWLEKEGMKLESDQTFILDSWTTLQDAFDMEQVLHPKVTKGGDIDDFAFWAQKIDYSDAVMVWLRSLKCHVVVLFHEIQTRDPATGQLLQKIDPLMQGGFLKKLKVHFPNFFRMRADEQYDTKGNEIACKYSWQVHSNKEFDAKCNLNVPESQLLVEPTWESFIKYGQIKETK